jgi:hypothetical protein
MSVRDGYIYRSGRQVIRVGGFVRGGGSPVALARARPLPGLASPRKWSEVEGGASPSQSSKGCCYRFTRQLGPVANHAASPHPSRWSAWPELGYLYMVSLPASLPYCTMPYESLLVQNVLLGLSALNNKSATSN